MMSFVKNPGIQIQHYFDTVLKLKPLFETDDFKKHVTGFYINGILDNNIPIPSVRLSYYTTNGKESEKTILKFIKDNSLNLFTGKGHSPMHSDVSVRFRKVLYLYTLIGIDLISRDPLGFRKMFVDFDKLAHNSPQLINSSYVLEPEIMNHSISYKFFNEGLKDKFWDAMDLEDGEVRHLFCTMFWVDYKYPKESPLRL